MRKIIVFILCLVLLASKLQANSIEFGDSTIVSLITCEPGKSVYAKFGHTALRIRDMDGLDLVYNYGVFDFKANNFYWKFLRGQTDYVLAVYPTFYFLKDYEERNSTVWEQKLNLCKEEKDKLIQLLNINYLPENRMYRYNFVYDNCSTRPYEIIASALNGAIISDLRSETMTMRSIITDYLSDSPWVELGVNLIFGLDADKAISVHESVFLPEYLKNYVQHAKIYCLRKDQINKNFVTENHALVISQATPSSNLHLLFHPFLLTVIWLIAGGVIMKYRRNMDSLTNRLFDFILYLIFGLGGLVVFMLMFFSEHPLVGNNLNILWLNPFNLIIAFLILFKVAPNFLFYYNILYMLMIIAYFVVTVLLTHSMVLIMLPLQGLIFLRLMLRERHLLHKLFVPTAKGFRRR